MKNNEYNYVENGDCLRLINRLPDNSVDLVITDPPYKICTNGGPLYADRPYYKEIREMSDGISDDILDELCRVLKHINIYIFCSQKQIIPLLTYFVTKKNCNWNILSWHKINPVPACGNKYLTDTEFILFFKEKGVRIYGDYSTKFTYYVSETNRKDKKKYGHPTVKPQIILKNLIINSSKENDVILDPFAGSGSTLVAAANLNRRYIGFEIDSDYYNTILTRLKSEIKE